MNEIRETEALNIGLKETKTAARELAELLATLKRSGKMPSEKRLIVYGYEKGLEEAEILNSVYPKATV
jgi:hypothetical protein